MPISVTCAACASSFTVKDEYAGKRAKCPNCAEPLTVPAVAAPPVAAPVLARPVVAARVPTKPPADEDDEPVRPKRTRGADNDDDAPKKKRRTEDDEDDKPAARRKRGEDEEPPVSPKRNRGTDDDEPPVSPKRKRGADDDAEEPVRPKRNRGADSDDDAPKGKRRRRDDDDDEPKKKKGSALPLILGIVGGVLLLCCGGPAGAWFFWIKPAGEKVLQEAEAEVARRKQEAEQAKLNQTKPTERPKEEPPVADLKAIELAQLQKADRQKYDKKWVRITGPVPRVNIESQPGKADWGQLHVGVPPGAVVVCHFDAAEWATRGVIDDEFVYSVVGLYDDNVFGVSMKHCRVVGQAVAEPATPVGFADLVNSPAKYTGKMVEVTALVKSTQPFGNGTLVVLYDTAAERTARYTHPGTGTVVPPNAGDRVTVKAKVSVAGAVTVDLDFRKLVSRLPGDGKPPPPPPPSALSVTAVMQDAGRLQAKSVAVRGKVKLVIEHVDGDQGTIVFEPSEGSFTLHAVFPPGKWRKDFVRGGEDTIDVKGTLSGLLGTPGTGLHYDITDCELTRRVTKDGKDVPLPPVTPANKPSKATAEELTAEFAKDANAAAKKYTDKSITISGTVERVLMSGTKVTLKGLAADGAKKAYVVDVSMAFDQRDEVKKLKEGDKVTLTGKYRSILPASTTAPNRVAMSDGVIEK